MFYQREFARTLCINLVFVLMLSFCSLAMSDTEPNGLSGVSSVTSGIAYAASNCWDTILDREGTDGGHITVEINACEIYQYEVYTWAQGAGTTETADLEPGDMFVVWDEDSGHGGNTWFSFSGTYSLGTPAVFDVSCDAATNYITYTIDTSGTLTITSTGENEHDAIHVKSNAFDFWKDDGIVDPNECVSPGDEMTYTIYWDNDTSNTYTDCWIIDYLPDGVDYPEGFASIDPNFTIIPADSGYDEPNHTYTWIIGDIGPGDSGSVSIDVVVNEKAEPDGELVNIAELWSDQTLLAGDIEKTLVCCWLPSQGDPNIIYVDINAPGPHIGTSWQTAYKDLHDALKRIEGGCSGNNPQVWVADGTYEPGDDESYSFVIPDGVKVYGGFGGVGVYETSIDERDFKEYESILNGYIGIILNEYEEEVDGYNNTVVTMGDDSLLDGFTVERSGEKGIDGSGVTSTVKNCLIKDNERNGILCEDGTLSVQWCEVKGSGWEGIYQVGRGYNLDVDNCKIHDNQRDGILTDSSVLKIKNSLVYSNGLGSTPNDVYYGINIGTPSSNPEIYNNTIVYNVNEGISYFENDPNDTFEANVRNNILWYNNDDGLQFSNNDPNHPESHSHNCTADSDPNYTSDAYDNLSCEPGFAYADDPNGMYNFHLAYDSLCVNAGDNSVVDTGDVDMDNEDRIYGTIVDIGADEAYSCDPPLSEDDIYNELDFNADGIVNNHEYYFFSCAWETYDPNHPLCDPNDDDYVSDPNDPDYINASDKFRFNSKCDLNDDLTIDLADIRLFAQDWLWEACWRKSQRQSTEILTMVAEEMMMPMGMLAPGVSAFAETETAPAEMTETGLIDILIGLHRMIDDITLTGYEDSIDMDALYDIKESIEDELRELK